LANDETTAVHILKSYRNYILSADTDELIEEWYDITKCAEKLFGENGNKKCKAETILTTSVINALAQMAEAIRDKKRYEFYSVMSQCYYLIEEFVHLLYC
jgi:hypothetical protein